MVVAASLEWLLQNYHLSAREVVYIGDTVSDIMACKAVGIDCLSAAWGVSETAAQDLARHNKHVFCFIQSLYNHLLPLMDGAHASRFLENLQKEIKELRV